VVAGRTTSESLRITSELLTSFGSGMLFAAKSPSTRMANRRAAAAGSIVDGIPEAEGVGPQSAGHPDLR
jgi:hypothetical protein